MDDLPTTMNAVVYSAPRIFEIKEVPLPQVADDEVLVEVRACGICGTDSHVHEGEFIAQFPLTPGHEVVGVIAALGKDVTGFAVGDRCVADPATTCGTCFFCRRGKTLYCEDFKSAGLGGAGNGGVAEYITFRAKQVYKFFNLTDEEATLCEPAACVVHGLDVLNAPTGVDVLVCGAGPTGLIMAQLLKLNGAHRVVIAANKGIKTDIAKTLNAANEYIELDRNDPEPQWEQLKKDNPYGFDVVVEATGSEQVANRSIEYVRRGGTLLVYGVYDNAARVSWPPSKIFGDEIKIIGSFAQTHCFPRAVAYLDSGKVNVKGMITDTFKIPDYQKALDKMNSKTALKLVVKP